MNFLNMNYSNKFRQDIFQKLKLKKKNLKFKSDLFS